MFTRILAAITLLAAFSASAVAQQWSLEQQEVWAEIQKSWDAWISGDVEESYKYVHPQGVFWNSANSVPIDQKTAYTLEQGFIRALATKRHGATVTPLTIIVDGDVAVVHVYYRAFEEVRGETPKYTTSRWMQVYKKEGDTWMELANYGHFE